MTSGISALAALFAAPPSTESWTAPLDGLVVSLAWVVSAVGVAVIVWGVYCSVLRFIAAETASARGGPPKSDTRPARLPFGNYLLPGLDFLLAGSVIKTLAVPTWQQVAVVAGLGVVRTLLSLSNAWEPSAQPAVKEAPALTDRAALPPAHPEEAPQLSDNGAPVNSHVMP
jgi:uncharacterized membrane protein